MRGNLPILLLILLALAAACTGPASPPSRAPESAPPLPEGPEDAENPCVQACLRQSQMEARAWEAIVADCRRSCAADAATPR